MKIAACQDWQMVFLALPDDKWHVGHAAVGLLERPIETQLAIVSVIVGPNRGNHVEGTSAALALAVGYLPSDPHPCSSCRGYINVESR